VKLPPTPSDEQKRLQALRALKILDTPPEERFDRVTRLAKRLFDVPIVLISLVDENRQWFKSRQGLDAEETPREISFCGHAIVDDSAMVVEDASHDERFFDNPLVTGDPRIRFYAGHPLASVNGSKLGTLCIVDRAPRVLSDEDIKLLKDLASMVEAELFAFDIAMTDPLTGLSSRLAFEQMAEHALSMCRRTQTPCSILFIDLDQFKRINDQFGHEEGDRALREMAQLLLDTFRHSDVIGRLGGDEFCVLTTGSDQASINSTLDRFEANIRVRNDQPNRKYPLAYSIGVCVWDPDKHESIAELLREADREMYVHKRSKVRS